MICPIFLKTYLEKRIESMNKLIWKYGHVNAICRCNEKEHLINFTTLCPMFNPITSEDYEEYHKNIDFVSKKLKPFGFDFCLGTVMLVHHENINKKEIEIILKQDIL